MSPKEIYSQLIEAYSEENLNKLAYELLKLYKEKQYGSLKKIAEIISPWIDIKIEDNGKGFSRFMMLYHPDKGNYNREQIEKLYKLKNTEELLKYSHILHIQNIEELTSAMIDDDIDFSPIYEWDFSAESGFHVEFDDVEDDDEKMFYNPAPSYSAKPGYAFYDAVKMRIYGNIEIEFPSYYLEDLDDIEMSQSEINNLEGIEYCIHVVTLDLSDNLITDISLLSGLSRIEELNISDNHIGYIDAISNLLQLKSINISNNYITDISPLLELEQLEYVDLSGNKISSIQITELEELGVRVVK